MRSPDCTNPTSTTYYLYDPFTGGMSETVIAGSSTSWNDYVIADGRIVAVRVNSGSATTWNYVVGDHLASPTTVTTCGSSCTVEHDSYDAWGLRRNANASDVPSCTLSSVLTRGFTQHEMLDSFCLVNMNGRVYDPGLGLFISADSMVPNPYDFTGFQRYSYLGNAPLNGTDPTGHMEDYGHLPLQCINSCLYGDGQAMFGGEFLNVGQAGGVGTSWGQGFGFCNAASCSAGVSTAFSGGTNWDGSSASGSWFYGTSWSGDVTPPGGTETVEVDGFRVWIPALEFGTPWIQPRYPREGLGNGGEDVLFALGTLGASLYGTLAKAGVEAATTTLYRAVTSAELESIESTNAFSNIPGLESKYFSTTLEGAQSYASQAMAAFGDAPYSFVETDIASDLITPDMIVPNGVERGIPTIVVPTEMLPSLGEPIIIGR